MSEKISDEELKEWQRLADAATPGPWIAAQYAGHDCAVYSATSPNLYLDVDGATWEQAYVNARLIAAVRNAIPRLIEALLQLDGEWRTGRKVGRTIYRNDQLVGIMDTPELASEVVAALMRRHK